jgi:hypothetical protein
MTLEPDVRAYLDQVAKHQRVTVSKLLRGILHVDTIYEDERFQRLFAVATESTTELFRSLDERLRIANPGLHYVYRHTYLGYRREVGDPSVGTSERSQVFVSVIPRRGALHLVLPVDPDVYAQRPGVEMIAGKGHHGCGDVAMKVMSAQDLETFFDVFDDWIKTAS